MDTCSIQRLRAQTAIAFLLFNFIVICSVAYGQEVVPKKVAIADDLTLHYVERGSGEPIVFVHGLVDEYSVWLQQLEGFANEGYRAIAYSRTAQLSQQQSNSKEPLRITRS